MARACDFLDDADHLPLVDIETLLGDRGAVIVAPHPDDESLGCGALIAAAAAERREVRVIIVSDGVGSHPSSRKYPAPRLRALRESETLAAVAELGMAEKDVTFLGLPDRFVPGNGTEAEKAVATIVRLCGELRARALFVTWRHDPHCDHQAAYAIARAAQRRSPGVRLFEYTVWGHSLPADTEVNHSLSGYRFNGGPWRDRKRAAIWRHKSQISDLIDDDPAGFRLSHRDLARLERCDEIFLEAEHH